MVKGISKRVIVVKAPVSSMFDEAIFILGDNTLSHSAVDAENVLREACAVADDYVRTHCSTHKRISRKTLLCAVISSLLTFLLSSVFFLFLL